MPDDVIWVCEKCWNGEVLLLGRLEDKSNPPPCEWCGTYPSKNAVYRSWMKNTFKTTITGLVPGKPNANGRIYSREILEKAIDKFRKNSVEKRIAIVSLQDPLECSFSSPLKDACALVTSIELKEDTVEIDFETLNTDAGKTLRSMIAAGKAAFSAAGMGSVNSDNTIGDDYSLSYITAIEETKE